MQIPDLSSMNLTPAEAEEAKKILAELAKRGDSDAYKQLMYQHYAEIPVDIDTFIESSDYLGNSTGNGKNVFPYWRNALREILHYGKSYDEIIFAGAIGLGKSFIGCILGAYQLYKVLCLKNPQAFYDLAQDTPIVFAFFNIHKYLAFDVAYGLFQRFLQNSPWFLRHGQIRGAKNREYYPDNNIQLVVGCDPEHVIGKNVLWALLDEMSFAKHPNPDMMKSGIMDLYRQVRDRMNSRFRIGGVFMASAVLISSKRTDSDFLDQYAQLRRNEPDVYIVDEPHWVVKPQAYGTKRFRLAVGGKTRASICIPDDDKRPDEVFIDHGYTRVIYPPIELRRDFEEDMDHALRDYAGISTTEFTKYIQYVRLQKCYSTKLVNAFTTPEPIMGLINPKTKENDTTQLNEFFDETLIPNWMKRLPIFIHLDIAYSGDGYGIGAVAAAGTRTQFNEKLGEMTTDPVYIHLFSARIKAPKGDQVSLEKVRVFIYWLKFTCGWNIKGVSTDGFQSVETRQMLLTRGIEAVCLSLDKTPVGYNTFRSAVYEKRIAMIEIPILETELINLERNERTGKIDHPRDGSKDAADGIAGAVYNASLHEEEYSSVHESIDTLLNVNEPKRSMEETSTEDLKAQLMNIGRRHDEDTKSRVVNENDDIDTIMGKVTGRSDQENNGNVSEEMKTLLAMQGIIL